jgi:formylglycine-generating enzyme
MATKTIRFAPLPTAALGLVVACCSGEVVPFTPPDGASDAGSGADVAGYDLESGAGMLPLSGDIESAGQAPVTTLTLGCAGECVDVQAVGRGGFPPYTYAWSDGATGPTRHLCPLATETLSVAITDTGVTGGEFARAPQTVHATLTVQVLGCADAGPPTDASAPSDGAAGDGPIAPPGCGVASRPPSCKPGGPGLTTCGQSNSDCCCASLEVAGGTFYRTYTNDGSGPTGEADPATVSTFRLDKYDVTVGRFRQFVDAWNGGLGYAPPAASGKHTHLNAGRGLASAPNVSTGQVYEPGWVATDDGNVAPTAANLACHTGFATWTPSAGNGESLPIDCVNWYEAYAFCIWDGGFLPSEAEWAYAAAGGSEQREYPWGSAAPGTSNQYAIYGCNYPGGATCSGIVNIAPVGSAPMGAGLWGQLDLGGEVYVWNLDWYDSYADPCIDGADLSGAGIRVERGSSYEDNATTLVSTYRYNTNPASRDYGVGVRCARTP